MDRVAIGVGFETRGGSGVLSVIEAILVLGIVVLALGGIIALEWVKRIV